MKQAVVISILLSVGVAVAVPPLSSYKGGVPYGGSTQSYGGPNTQHTSLPVTYKTPQVAFAPPLVTYTQPSVTYTQPDYSQNGVGGGLGFQQPNGYRGSPLIVGYQSQSIPYPVGY